MLTLISFVVVFILGALTGGFVVRNNQAKAIRFLNEAKAQVAIEMAKLKART